MHPTRKHHRLGFFLLFTTLGGCAWNAAGDTGCELAGQPHLLPETLHESSGVAASRIHSGVIWTHNDGGGPFLFALDEEGSLLARIPFAGADLWDWEDLSVGDCPSGSCLYLADTGDNEEVRRGIQLIRLPEPGVLDADAELVAEVFPMILPDGPRDVEALFVLPGEEVFVVSKGRADPLTVYRYPPPLRPGEQVTLEEVQHLSDGSMSIPAQITGADASPEGDLVVLRTYEALFFYRVDGGTLVPMDGGRVTLRTLEEPQGEGVGIGPGGQILLTTEAGNFGGLAALRVLRCQKPFGG